MLSLIALRSFKSLAFAVVLGAALSAGVPAAYAGGSELKALQAALPLGTTIDQATSQELYDAFLSVVFAPDSKFNTTKKQGVVAGEALKAAGPNATNAGMLFGQQILAGNATPPLDVVFGDRRNFVALAASTAGAGKGLNVTQIPGLSSELFATELGSTFTTVALATKSKPGIGAIFGGRARQIFASSPGTAEADSVVLANSAIFDKKLATAAQDIAQWIAAEYGMNMGDSAAFAVRVADGNGLANNKLALKIATGAAAGDSTNAGNIIHNLLNQQLLQDNGSLIAGSVAASQTLVNTMVKGATTIAKNVSAVADIEEIQKIGNALGQLIGTPGVKPGTGIIGTSKAASFVKTLATAVMSKPRGNNTISDRNSDANKADEIAEVTAYLVGGMLSSPEFDVSGLTGAKQASAVKKAAGVILKIIKAGASVKPKLIGGVAQGPSQNDFAADVAASVALTVLNSTVDPLIKTAVQDLLLFTDAKGVHKTAASIFKNSATQIFDRLSDVYTSTNTGRFEDGNDPLRAVSDPETDFRPFS